MARAWGREAPYVLVLYQLQSGTESPLMQHTRTRAGLAPHASLAIRVFCAEGEAVAAHAVDKVVLARATADEGDAAAASVTAKRAAFMLLQEQQELLEAAAKKVKAPPRKK